MEGGTLAGDVVAEGAAASRGARKEERTHRAELIGGMHDDSVVMVQGEQVLAHFLCRQTDGALQHVTGN